MKKAFLFLLLNISISLCAQESKFSLELNYPIPTGDNFIGKDYTGIVDVGGKYSVLRKNSFNCGVVLNSGLLKFDKSSQDSFVNYTVNAYTIQPNLFFELNFKSIEKFHPYTSVGYSFIMFRASGTINGSDVSDLSETQSGINFNFGLAFDFTKNFFISSQYNFIKLNKEDGIPNTKFNNNVGIIKFGIGMRL